ncbi:PIG-L deacetylase family protein [Actinomycetospora aeridis]|uniref:PIG-L family deacetylase n=1 Tax=Actinomycetospora aeridis TaxID=3129231 RepID=A0ABU8N0J5_9PSEU
MTGGTPRSAPTFLADVPPGEALLFLSAHLDDAVLSCGGLMAAVVDQHPLLVVTIFSEASPPPHTRAARTFLRQCGAPNAATLFAERRAEDRAVLDGLGARVEHLGEVDALFRRRGVPGPLHAAERLPELVHRYPTYRFDIALGRVSRGDRKIVDDVTPRVRALADEVGARTVFCPVGVGRHVDHLLTRRIGEALGLRVIHYSDFPYDLTHPTDPAFLAGHGAARRAFADGTADRERLVRGYTTQVDALFGDGTIPATPEVYYPEGVS